MRTFSLTITFASLYYFEIDKSAAHMIRERSESVKETERISGVKHFSNRIKEFKVR
jgi:hypothetical protein